MEITLTASNIITAAAVITAIGTIVGVILAVYRWYLKQNEQSETIKALHEQHCQDMQSVNSENALIMEGLSACLDGLMQLKCNHTVPSTKEKIDEFLIKRAHIYKEE